jgi:hypothetical protein
VRRARRPASIAWEAQTAKPTGVVELSCRIPGRRDVCYSTPGSYGEYVFLLGELDWPHMPKLITSARENYLSDATYP